MIKGQRCLVTGGAGTIGSTIVDQLVAAGAREVIVLDNFVRGRRENLAGALGSGKVRIVDGDIRDRRLVTELMQGIDLVFHQAAIQDHAVRRRAQARPRGPGRRHLRGRRGRGGRRCPQGGRRVVGLGVRARRAVPDIGAAPPLRQRHALRRGQDLQRGPAAQLPRDARPRLRGAALLQRVRPADGHLRPVHRGAHQVDGADRGGAAAAHPRRRHADDGLRLHRGHRPRQPARRLAGRDRRGLQHRQRDGDQPDRARPAPCCAPWTATCRWSSGRLAASTRSPAGWPTCREPPSASAGRPR